MKLKKSPKIRFFMMFKKLKFYDDVLFFDESF